MLAATFEDIQDESRKVNIEWMTFTDSLSKDYVYTSQEQFKNGHEIELVKKIAGQTIACRHIRSYDRMVHASGMTSKLLKCIGTGTMWLALNRWSHVFLAKRGQRLGDSRGWFNMCLHFEGTLKHFFSWLIKIYPQCDMKERMKAVRILWITTFLETLYKKTDLYNHNVVFAFALLYPLVDDYLDTEKDPALRIDFATRLKDRIEHVKPATNTWSSSHPESQVVGELVDTMMQHFRPSSNNRSIAVRIMESLIDWEVEKNPTDILYAATCKGGLTLCIIHLLVKDSLTVPEASTMMRLGLALQVVDDLQDVQEDMAEQTNTLATSHYYSSSQLCHQYARAINFIRHGIFQEKFLQHKLSLEEGLKTVLCESLVLLCFEAAAASPALEAEDRFTLTQHSPLSTAFLKSHPVEMTLHRLTSLFN